jgi:hypothetical protein
MLYIFFAIACVCSSFIAASEKELQEKAIKKAQYDKILDERIKDPVERAKYAEGYTVLRDEDGNDISIKPLSEVYVGVPILDAKDNAVGFMSFPYPIAKELNDKIEKRLAEKNKNKLELTK